MRSALAVLCVLLAMASADAAPRRAGANHHLGDDSFVAAFGRAPTVADGEKLRMHVHLRYVHDLLAARSATSPGLSARRTELLGYLADYLAAGITPVNDYVPYRNPVFIDRAGRICAVGYLIERSVGRSVAEGIAATHRLDYLEDIAATMPEVARWIATSGFTLDELASIQPGYPGPDVQHQTGWLVAREDNEFQAPLGEPLPADGVYADEDTGMTGTFRGGQMIGVWTRTVDGITVGKGTFTRGSGTWTSFHANGRKLAEGPYRNSHANGIWRIYHPSGRLAATGAMRAGRRDGSWTLFYDNPASTVVSRGSFSAGQTDGGWKHYDERGTLVATSSGGAWGGLSLDIEPGRDGVRREVHTGFPADNWRLDGFYLGKDRLYVSHDGAMFDGDSRKLTVDGDVWTAQACKWSAKRREAARIGDATTLDAMLRKDREKDDCTGAITTLPAARAKRYLTMLASRKTMHAPVPAFDLRAAEPAAEEAEPAPAVDGDGETPILEDNADDFAAYLVDGIRWYVEWPHVDDTFRVVYAGMPGYGRRAL
jgi:hypothetical protein